MTTALRLPRVASCPSCGTPLDEGPVQFRCAACRRSVWAADLSAERVIAAKGHACRPCRVCRSCRICYPHTHPFPPARQKASAS